MKLRTATFKFRVLTPAMIGGAVNRASPGEPPPPAEMRIPSIRGMLRWWHAVVFGTAAAQRVWGKADKESAASMVALSLRSGPHFSPDTTAEMLPHKHNPNERGQRGAFVDSEVRFALCLSGLPGCRPTDWRQACRTLRLWLLLGGIGSRQNRAAGSVWPVQNPPADAASFERQCNRLAAKVKVRFAVLALSWTSCDEARKIASDMIGGPMDQATQIDLEKLDSPTGSAPFWRDSLKKKGKFPRISSPLKFKVGKFGAQYYLIAVWDGRDNTNNQLQNAVALMLSSPSTQKQRIGQLLEPEVFPAKGKARLMR